MKFLMLLLTLATPFLVMAHDVPLRSDSGAISYATDNLLSRRGELRPPEILFDPEDLNKVFFSELRIEGKELQKVKYYIINGETQLASALLSKLAYSQTKLRPVIYRYLATLAFIQGDFHKTHRYLSLKELQEIPHYSKICVLKVLSEIVLDKLNTVEVSWNRCQLENQNDIREGNLIWLDTLVQLKLNPRPGITKVPFKRIKLVALENEDVKMFMKLGLYLNQEDLLAREVPELTVDQLQDPEIRELAGQVFFRTGSLAKAFRFVEDLKSPNAENIKGNLYLLRKKYELAYAQFKLALEQKINSQNAMERLLPLAWLLGDWEGGSQYSEQVIASHETEFHKLTLMAAFNMQKGNYDRAQDILDAVAQRSQRGAEIEVSQLASFTSLMRNKSETTRKNALISCSQYDLVNCWTLFQLSQWSAFPLTIRREDKIPERKEWEKLSQSDINDPIKELSFVNQIDIEELDDKLIQLIPTP